MNLLENEFKFYLDNQASILAEYGGKFVVIVGDEVVGAFDTMAEAYYDSAKKYEPGTFLIQHCTEGEDAYTQSFTSRVIFA
ncbi:MAG: hypothetical protein J5831_01020 [Bacteroidales bacterium]|nr:hypothetical protein [Bacteroidales bacterium]